MQGDVCQQGRDNPPLRRPRFGRTNFSALEDTRFQPAAYLSVDDWDAVEFRKQGLMVYPVKAFFDTVHKREKTGLQILDDYATL